MIYKKVTFIAALLFVFIIAGCHPEVNSPNQDAAADLELYKFETIETDLGLLQEGGMSLAENDGVFSIGWNEIFRKSDDDSIVKGTAFAIAFGDTNTNTINFPKRGLNMGNITISYAGANIEMHKMSHPRRGIAYSLFPHPFGGSNILLQYLPSTQYVFNVSGSNKFSPFEIILTSPSALIDITSHSFLDSINTNQDLTITWTGGNDGKTAIRAMAHLPNALPGPNHKKAFVKILDNNPGQFTITEDQLRLISAGGYIHKIAIEVSQVDRTEVEHNGKILNTVMRNGSSVLLNISK